MKLNLSNVDNIVKVNNLPLIDSAVLLTKENRPAPEGLLSYEIFGRSGSKDRRTKKAYIDLKRNFLHPLLYRALTAMDKRVEKIVQGKLAFVLGPRGVLIEDNEKGKTGLSFLYDNWGKIKWEETGSKGREFKIDFLKGISREMAFVSKWIVISAGYRDVDLNTKAGVSSVDDINPLYQSLINASNRMDGSDSESFIGNLTETSLQNILVEIHTKLTQRLAKKNGLIHRGLLGKGVDFAVRGVISAPMLSKAPSYREQEVPYGYIGLPLTMCLAAFKPFVMAELENFFAEFRLANVRIKDSNNRVLMDEAMDTISSSKLEKLLTVFAKSKEDRLSVFNFKTEGGNEALDIWKKDLGRLPTLTDIFYLITEKAIKGKHVVATRYPLTY
jgi:hypothetical protein